MMLEMMRTTMGIIITLPLGNAIMIPVSVVHRNPQIFSDPFHFDPERFEGDWRIRFPKYAFLPYGGGPHVSIGAHLAIFEGRLVLPMMVRRI
jgi:cytochrome P450